MKAALLTILFTSFSLIIFSQHREGDTLYYRSELDEILSTTEYAVVIKSMYPKNMKRINVRIGAEGSYRTNFLVLSYHIPGKHYFELGAGIGAGAMGTFLFHTREKEERSSQSIEVYGNSLVKAAIPIVKQKNFGIRYGLGLYHLSYNSYRSSVSEFNEVKSTRIPLTIGISRFNITHGRYSIYKNPRLNKNIEEIQRRGQSMFSLNLDAVFFPKYFHSLNEGFTVIQDESIQLKGKQIYQSTYDEIIEETEDKFCLHASIQSTFSNWSQKGNFGFRLNLGTMYYPNRQGSILQIFNVTGGLGIVWFFHDRVSL